VKKLRATAQQWVVIVIVLLKFKARGVRKVTIGITGLWNASVQSDHSFWSFDVGSSYHWEAEFSKCRIVHPLTGNVSWV